MTEETSIAVQIARLALQLGVILFAARICGKLAQKVRIPGVLGELTAGIIIGPYLLGSLSLGVEGFTEGLFPLLEGASLPVSTPLYAIATLGSIVLLFMSGLETDLKMFFRYSVAGTVIGIGGVIFSFAFGAGLGMVWLDTSLMDPRCLFMGILSTATSVGITARILSERKSIDSPEGTTILAAAVIDDVLGIICLAVVMGLVGVSAAGSSGEVDWVQIEIIAAKSIGIWLGFTVLGLIFAHHIAKMLKCFRPAATYSILALGLAMLLAGVFEESGLAMIVGAYVMGLSLSKTDIAFAIQRQLHGIYNFLVPVFFVVMGMLVDVRVLADPEILMFGLTYGVLAVLAKVLGCALPALVLNFNMVGALRIGMGMIPRGEVALIIAGIGATTMMQLNGESVPVIDPELFGVAIIMTLLTTLVAPPLLAGMLSINKKGVRHEKADTSTIHTSYQMPTEVFSEFILEPMVANFRQEGFRHSEVERDGSMIHFRKEGVSFILRQEENCFIFESAPSEVPLIRTVVYETLVGLHQKLSTLKMMATPGGMEQVIQNIPQSQPAKLKQLHPEKIIAENCVLVDLKATSHEEAIKELLETLKQAGKIVNFDQCLTDVLDREKVVSTCVDNNLALPHARTEGVKSLVAAVGRSSKGYKEFGDHGKDVKLTILSLSPKAGDEPYLQFVAHLAAITVQPDAMEKLMAATDAASLREALIKKPVKK